MDSIKKHWKLRRSQGLDAARIWKRWSQTAAVKQLETCFPEPHYPFRISKHERDIGLQVLRAKLAHRLVMGRPVPSELSLVIGFGLSDRRLVEALHVCARENALAAQALKILDLEPNFPFFKGGNRA